MKLTSHSKKLMNFLIKQNCINNIELSKSTKGIMKNIYTSIENADNYIQMIKNTPNFYIFSSEKINNVNEIPKPKLFNSESFPLEIRNHIDLYSNYYSSYTFSLFDRNINIIFIEEKPSANKKYQEYIEKILTWFWIVNKYASKKCSKNITIYIYLTSLKKELPESYIHILNENNINTAFTYTCLLESEIVVYRQEEWFKVFIHETFHNFALDFSDMDVNKSHKHINKIFPVESDINLFESYTEFWAEIMNSAFCSYFILKNKKNFNEFLSNFNFLINFERTYGFFQMVKVLKFIGLTYNHLYSNSKESVILRKTLYKEKTNVLSYYVIRVILINNYQGFLQWCNKNNSNLIQFKKTNANLDSFCKFIEENYKKKELLNEIENMENILSNINMKKQDKFIMNNMRMTVSELG